MAEYRDCLSLGQRMRESGLSQREILRQYNDSSAPGKPGQHANVVRATRGYVPGSAPVVTFGPTKRSFDK